MMPQCDVQAHKRMHVNQGVWLTTESPLLPSFWCYSHSPTNRHQLSPSPTPLGLLCSNFGTNMHMSVLVLLWAQFSPAGH